MFDSHNKKEDRVTISLFSTLIKGVNPRGNPRNSQLIRGTNLVLMCRRKMLPKGNGYNLQTKRDQIFKSIRVLKWEGVPR